MVVIRKMVGQAHQYKGHLVIARLAQPDLLGYVGNTELGGFFLNIEAVRAAGERYIDDQIKTEEEKARGKRND